MKKDKVMDAVLGIQRYNIALGVEAFEALTRERRRAKEQIAKLKEQTANLKADNDWLRDRLDDERSKNIG